MAITRRTSLNQIEVLENHIIQVRLGKLIEEDGVMLNTRWHRTLINPGEDAQLQMEAVNEHLVLMGEVPLPQEEIDRIVAIAGVEHTPKVVLQYRTEQAKVA